LKPAKDGGLCELRPGQFALALNEARFLANSFAVLVNRVWSTRGICVMVFMEGGLSRLL
jgi:hypothetical protein